MVYAVLVETGLTPRASTRSPGGTFRAPAMFTTLLMSTGLTYGTNSSLYGFNAGILDRAQFSVQVTTVVASAVIPALIAQRWFSPEPRRNPVVAAER